MNQLKFIGSLVFFMLAISVVVIEIIGIIRSSKKSGDSTILTIFDVLSELISPSSILLLAGVLFLIGLYIGLM